MSRPQSWVWWAGPVAGSWGRDGTEVVVLGRVVEVVEVDVEVVEVVVVGTPSRRPTSPSSWLRGGAEVVVLGSVVEVVEVDVVEVEVFVGSAGVTTSRVAVWAGG